MDFITREERDLEHTETIYGKKSDQYLLHNMLLDAENKLKTTGSLELGKMCKQEYISIRYNTNIFDKNTVGSRIKRYWNMNKTEMRRMKEEIINRSISEVIDNDVYNLILNKYEILL